MFLIIVGFQTALIYFHHFSPFERESNLLAVARGAHPAPRYWAVLLLDLCTALLLFLLAMTVLPLRMYGDFSLPEHLELMIVYGIVPAGLYAAVHHFVNDAVAYFPNLWQTVWRLATALGLGAALTFDIVYWSVYLAGRSYGAMYVVPEIFFVSFLFGILIFLLQALAYPLRVIPLVGPVLQAAATTGLWYWWIKSIGEAAAGVVDHAAWPGLTGLEGAVVTIARGWSIVALSCMAYAGAVQTRRFGRAAIIG